MGIRVHELAKELKKSNREVSDRLRKLEIVAKSNLASISPEDSNKVRVSFGKEPLPLPKPKKAKKPAAKPAAKKPAKKAAAKKAEKPAEKKPAGKKLIKPSEHKLAAKKAAEKEAEKEAEKAAEKAAETAAARAAAKPPEKKPAARPAEKKAEKAAAKPAVKTTAKPAEKKPAAKKAAKPAEKKPEAAGAARPPAAAQPAQKPSAAKKPVAPARPQPPQEPAAKKPEPRPLTEQERAAQIRAKAKPTLRVAPPDRKQAPTRGQQRQGVYRYVPKGRSAPRRSRGVPVTVTPKLIRVQSGLTVKEFAQKAGLRPGEVIKKLMNLGEMVTVNQAMDDEAIRLLAEELGVEIKIKASRFDELEEVDEIEDLPEDLTEKPPVVTVMGHVDHGKTKLLDSIRKTDVMGQESGGITQHIGAYQVTFNGKPITFIDTPGHESFTAMRARGAKITDIAVLVVAADDGVMPQTVEALDHALEAEVPIIVAVNKMDKPDADAHRVRQQLSEKGLIPDDWGGDTVFVDVSAKEGTNLDHLLEMILLLAEMNELRANPHADATGVVVEAKLDKARGPVITLLIERGTLKIGDVLVVGSATGRARAMFNDKGESVKEASPGQPVELLGLGTLPLAGDEFRVVEDDRKGRQITDRRRLTQKLEDQTGPPEKVSLENLFDRIKEGEFKELKVVVKADTQGSLEAVIGSLEKLPTEEVRLRVIHNGVGGITETDIMLASASEAIVLGFHVRPDSKAARAAELENVEIRTYRVIYKLTEDMEAALKGMLAPIFEEEIEGRVEVRQIFRVPGAGTVAGSYVLEGEIKRTSLVRIIRDGVIVHDGKVSTLRRFKDDVKSVAAGFECGVSVENFQDVKEGDILEAYHMKEVPR